MAIPGTVPVTGPVAPTAVGDVYPSHIDTYGQGGYRSVADNTERDAITAERRSEGMRVFVTGTGLEWQLAADLTTWNAYNPGGLDPADVMLKSTYDTDDDGIVDNSEALGGQLPAYYTNRTNHTGTQAQATITNLVADLAAKENIADIGTNGHAAGPLAGGLIPLAQVPFAATAYLGTYNANTNVPALANGVGTAGDFYIATVAGAAGPQGATNIADVVVYDGAVWQVGPSFTAGIGQIDTDSGSEVGPIATINSTAQIAPSTDRQYMTDDENDAFAASQSPSSTNAVVTESRLQEVVTVNSGMFTPYLFADGKDIGIGTLRTLTSLGYNAGTAAAAWPRTAADPRFTINVNTTTIDTIVLNEWFLAAEQTCNSFLFCPGGLGFYTNQTAFLPRNQTNWVGSGSAGNRSHDRFVIDFNGSGVINGTANNFVVLDRFPANQTEATNDYLNTRFTIKNLFVSGNTSDLTNVNNIGLRLGPTTKSRYESIYAVNAAVPMALYFNICCELDNCEFLNWGTYGLLLSNGQAGLAYGGGWTGGATSNCQTNQTTITNSRWVVIGSTSAAAIFQYGGYNTSIKDPVIEGLAGPTTTTLIHYKAAGDQVEQLMDIDGLSVEALTCTRAGIRIESEKGFTWIKRGALYLSGPGQMPVYIEGDSRTGASGQPTIIIENQYGGLPFRSVNPSGTSSFQYRWIINNAFPADYTNVFAAANWASTNGGIVPSAQYVRYTPPLV